MIETIEQRTGRLRARTAEVEFGLTTGDPHQADQLDLFILIDRPAQEFEFPVGPPAHVEHTVRSTLLVDDYEPAVVGKRLFCRYLFASSSVAVLVIGGG